MRSTYPVPRNGVDHAPLDPPLPGSLVGGGGVAAGSGPRPGPAVGEKTRPRSRSRVLRHKALELAPKLQLTPFKCPARFWKHDLGGLGYGAFARLLLVHSKRRELLWIKIRVESSQSNCDSIFDSAESKSRVLRRLLSIFNTITARYILDLDQNRKQTKDRDSESSTFFCIPAQGQRWHGIIKRATQNQRY